MAYSEYLNREHDARNKAIADFRAILDTADAEKRDLSAEEMEHVDRFDAEVDQRDGRIAKLEKMAAAEERTASVAAQLGDAVARTASETSGDTRLIVAIREAGSRLAEGFSTDRALDLVINLEKRAIADFSDNGALYTTDFATQVAIYQRTVSPWINLASVINADNGRPLNLPRLTADPTTYKPGEGTAITESTPTIGSAALTTAAYKALSYVSAEAEEDELIGLLPIIARVQGRSIGLSFGSDLTTALLAAATNGGTATGLGGAGTGTATFAGYEDLLNLKYSLAVPYRSVGVWIMSNGMILKARKYRDGQGQYLWQPAIAQGQPPTFDGDPVYEDPYLVTPASASRSVLYGDASAVVIKQMALRVAISTDFKFDTDQVAIKSVYRAGGALPDAAALKYLVSANT